MKLFSILLISIISLSQRVVGGNVQLPPGHIQNLNKCCPEVEGKNSEEQNKRECEASSSESGGRSGSTWTVPSEFSFSNQSFLVGLEENPLVDCEIETIYVPLHHPEERSEKSYLINAETGYLTQVHYGGSAGAKEEYRISHHKNQYCIRPEEDVLEIQICEPACTAKDPCVRKCCPHNSVLKQYDIKSEDHPCTSSENMKSEQPAGSETRYKIGLSALQSCVDLQLISPDEDAPTAMHLDFKVFPNGTTAYRRAGEWEFFYEPRDYCVDNIQGVKRAGGEDASDPLAFNVLYYCPSEASDGDESEDYSEEEIEKKDIEKDAKEEVDTEQVKDVSPKSMSYRLYPSTTHLLFVGYLILNLH